MDTLLMLGELIAKLPEGQLKQEFLQLYARLDLVLTAAENVEVRLIRTQWKVAEALERQARDIKSTAKDVKSLKSHIKQAILVLRGKINDRPTATD